MVSGDGLLGRTTPLNDSPSIYACNGHAFRSKSTKFQGNAFFCVQAYYNSSKLEEFALDSWDLGEFWPVARGTGTPGP